MFPQILAASYSRFKSGISDIMSFYDAIFAPNFFIIMFLKEVS